jgi:hypothetical protein
MNTALIKGHSAAESAAQQGCRHTVCGGAALPLGDAEAASATWVIGGTHSLTVGADLSAFEHRSDALMP